MIAAYGAFRVYRLRSADGESAERQMIASFLRYIDAEGFIQAELSSYSRRGTDAGCFWGSDDLNGHVTLWIQPSTARAEPNKSDKGLHGGGAIP